MNAYDVVNSVKVDEYDLRLGYHILLCGSTWTSRSLKSFLIILNNGQEVTYQIDTLMVTTSFGVPSSTPLEFGAGL